MVMPPTPASNSTSRKFTDLFREGVRQFRPTLRQHPAASGAVVTMGFLIGAGFAPLLLANGNPAAIAEWLRDFSMNALAGWAGTGLQTRVAALLAGPPPAPAVLADEIGTALCEALSRDETLRDDVSALLMQTEAMDLVLRSIITRDEQRAMLEALAAFIEQTQLRYSTALAGQILEAIARLAPDLAHIRAQLERLATRTGTSFYNAQINAPVVTGNYYEAPKLPPAPPVPPPPPAPPAPFTVPHKTSHYFVGRVTALGQLAQRLIPGRPIAVTGTGGIGKTQLAAEYAHRRREYYTGGVFWIAMQDPNTIAAQVADLAGPKWLDRADYTVQTQEARQAAVLRAWGQPGPRLLIFDNCEDPALVQQWSPVGGEAHILITSRRANWAGRTQVETLPLDPLGRGDSLDLLLAARPSDRTKSLEAAHAICDLLGDLPLALALAGAYLEASPSITLNAYHKILDKELLAHESLRSLPDGAPLPTDHAPSVAATFALSFNQLKNNVPVDLLARRLLLAAGQCTPDPIPLRLLVRACNLDPDGTATPTRVDPAITRLVALGLCDRLGVDAIRLHRLVAAYARARIPNATTIQASLLSALTVEFKAIREAGYLQTSTPYLPHAHHLTATAPDSISTAEGLNGLAIILSEQEDHTAARPLFERELAIYEDKRGPNDPSTAGSLVNLANVLTEQHDYAAARPLYERALIIQESTRGSNHPDTALCLNNLGTLLMTQEDYAAAQPLLDRALAIREATRGSNHPDTAGSLTNLAALLTRQRDYAAARLLYERALAIREATRGSNHPDTANSLTNLAALLTRQGDYATARPLHERALTIYESTRGSNHPDIALGLTNLADLLTRQGNYAAARPLLERALAIREATRGPNHLDTASTLNSLGFLLIELGDYAAARLCLDRAIAISEEVQGSTHSETGMYLDSLGQLLHRQGEYAAAQSYYERAVTILEPTLGPDHPTTRVVYDNLARLRAEINASAVGRPPE